MPILIFFIYRQFWGSAVGPSAVESPLRRYKRDRTGPIFCVWVCTSEGQYWLKLHPLTQKFPKNEIPCERPRERTCGPGCQTSHKARCPYQRSQLQRSQAADSKKHHRVCDYATIRKKNTSFTTTRHQRGIQIKCRQTSWILATISLVWENR